MFRDATHHCLPPPTHTHPCASYPRPGAPPLPGRVRRSRWAVPGLYGGGYLRRRCSHRGLFGRRTAATRWFRDYRGGRVPVVRRGSSSGISSGWLPVPPQCIRHAVRALCETCLWRLCWLRSISLKGSGVVRCLNGRRQGRVSCLPRSVRRREDVAPTVASS